MRPLPGRLDGIFNVDVSGSEPGTAAASSASRGHGLPKNGPVPVGTELRDGKWEPGLITCGRPHIEVTLKQAELPLEFLVLSSSSCFLFPMRVLSHETGRVLRNGVRVLGLVRGEEWAAMPRLRLGSHDSASRL